MTKRPTDMPDQSKFWDEWHQKINDRVPNWGTHFPLAEQVLPFLQNPRLTPILDLGCGQCNDAIYFADNKFEVYALDFSSAAIARAKQAINKKGLSSIHVIKGDISEPLPFEDAKFGAVYSHLSLQYFDNETTGSVFFEIHRVLKSGGILAFNAKSTLDFRYGEGKKIGPDMFNYNGHIRHFFSRKYVKELMKSWKILVLDEYEEKYGGSTEPSNFIKVIARKPQ